MNSKTISKMQDRYIGKICSIISSAMNRDFEEKICREHFVVRVKEIDMDGVWGVHPFNTDMFSFFSMNHIISIHEEFEINENDPEHLKMIQEFEKVTGKKIEPDIKTKKEPSSDSFFVDIESLSKLAEQAKSIV
jgi:hypothetical protein